MILTQNIIFDYEIFDYEIDDILETPEWLDIADGDYIKMELKYEDKVIMSGDTTHDNILFQMDSFIKGIAFGINQKICVKRGIITPSKFYECDPCFY